MILGIDTTTEICSAALACADGKILSISESIGRGHAEKLLPMIDDLVVRAQAERAAIQKIIVTRGPGSFTGLRIGASVAKGIAIAVDAELVGVSTLYLMAYQGARAHAVVGDFIVAIDAKRGEVFCQRFNIAGKGALPAARNQPSATKLSDFINGLSGEAYCFVNSADLEKGVQRSHVQSALLSPSAESLVKLMHEAVFLEQVAQSPATYEAKSLYIRPPDAKLPTKSPTRA